MAFALRSSRRNISFSGVSVNCWQRGLGLTRFGVEAGGLDYRTFFSAPFSRQTAHVHRQTPRNPSFLRKPKRQKAETQPRDCSEKLMAQERRLFIALETVAVMPQRIFQKPTHRTRKPYGRALDGVDASQGTRKLLSGLSLAFSRIGVILEQGPPWHLPLQILGVVLFAVPSSSFPPGARSEMKFTQESSRGHEKESRGPRRKPDSSVIS